MRKILSILSPFKGLFLLVLSLALPLNFLFAVFDPLVMKFLIDEGLIKQNFKFFIMLSLATVAVGTLIRFGFMIQTLLLQRLKNRVIENLTIRMFNSYYEIPNYEVMKKDKGYFMSRIYDEPSKLALSGVETLINLSVYSISLIGALAVALYLSWKLTICLSILIPILFKISKRFGAKITQKSKQENEKEANFKETLGRLTESHRTVKIFNLSNIAQLKLIDRLHEFIDVLYSRVKFSVFFQTLSSMFLSYGEIIVLISAAYWVLIGKLTIGGLMGFMSAFWKVIYNAQNIISEIPLLSKSIGGVERLHEFEALVQRNGKVLSFPEIELKDVSFSYGKRKIFSDINLKINRGEKVLILGPNGSGKTTLAYLICGFLKPDKGQVKTLKLDKISASLTPFHFIPGSLKENVNFEDLNEEKKELFEKLAIEFGLNDKLHKDPISFSAGEKKKAEIIMTLLKDADLYIFDEPLANIDVETKEKIINTILEYTRNKTLIVIKHGDEKYNSLFDKTIEV